jgi:hypothetical protein
MGRRNPLFTLIVYTGFLALLLCVGSGCGLMIHGKTQEVRFNVEPSDAKVYVDGKEIVNNRIELERKKDYKFEIRHPDYETATGRIGRKVDAAAVILDVFLTFYIGLLVDIPTGAIHKFEKEAITVRLEPRGAHLAEASGEERTPPPDDDEQKGLFTGFKPGQRTIPPAESGGQRWALVVGIQSYESSDIPKIPNASEDAHAVRDFLVNPEGGGYENDHVFLLTNEAATRRGLDRYLRNELKKKVQREDDLFLYFACHGLALPKAGTGNEDGLEKYLIPYDTVPEDVTVDGIAMNDLNDALNDIECRQIAMVLDCCFSGGARSISVGPATRNTTISSSFLKRLAKQRGTKRIKIITACSADELAQDDPQTGHGIFTTYFLEGLRACDDIDGDGQITLYEVFRHLDRKVRDRSSEIGQRQNPKWTGNAAYPFVMRKVTS